MNSKDRMISFVIPVFNEQDSLKELSLKISEVMKKQSLDKYEIIYVDDGSRDDSWRQILALSSGDPHRIKAIRFRRNFGKAMALSAGFKQVKGSIVFTMDADLQDDPVEIPNFLDKLDEGYDLVSGWKQKRNDPISKTWPSKFFNFVTSFVSGVKLHDFNCGFKAYRSEVLKSIRIYGELHRYIPILAQNQGFRVGEVIVHHHPRKHGRSKYGLERYVRGAMDLITVIATTKYLQKPGHLFGGVGFIFSFFGVVSLSYLAILKLLGEKIGNRPLLFFGVMSMILAVQFISLGVLAELIIREQKTSYIENQIIDKVNI